MLVIEFEGILSKLTVSDLDALNRDLYSRFDDRPLWDTGVPKAKNVRHITRWVKGDKTRIDAVLDLAKKKMAEREGEPKRGPVPNTHYISWLEFIKLPSYRLVSEAIKYGYNPRLGPRNNPVTKDGYLSVYSLHNMSGWASWKSSSLSVHERESADAISGLRLDSLMRLNAGRRMDQPALFPEGMLK